MTPADLAVLIRAAATDVLAGRGLGTGALPAAMEVVRPRNPAHGDYATTVALRAAPVLGVPASRLAGWLAGELAGRSGIAAAEVAGPGFVNVRLAAAARGALIAHVLTEGDGYGAGAGPVGVPAHRRVRVLGGGCRTSAELAVEVGADAARYALLRTPGGTEPVVDLELLAGRTDRNPAFRVRHAHARLCALARNAAELAVVPGDDHGLLTHPREGELVSLLGEFARVAPAAADRDEPHRLVRHLEELAAAFDRFDGCCRVLPMGDEPVISRHRARMALCAATRQVLANGLRLLGVSAPERM